MSEPSPAPSLPQRPRLVLRVGFAGRRDLSAEESARLEPALREVLRTLGHRLAALAPGVPVDTGREPPVSTFYARECPLLRLVTGLCEGADALAAQVLETVKIPPDSGAPCGPHTHCLETELAAVLPFEVETYRRTRPATFQAEFDRQLARCAWVLALDGHYDKPDDATLATLPEAARKRTVALADNRRARAYRAQSGFLLRQCDLLIAAANPDEPGKAGGTLETVRAALGFELPVIFLHTGQPKDLVHLIEPQGDLHSVLAEEAPGAAQWQQTLRQWVTQLTADPDGGLDPAEPAHVSGQRHGETLLQEYFDDAARLPLDAAGKRRSTWRERVWTWFEKHFRAGPGVKGDDPLPPFDRYRKRATDLNYHYSGQYRGAFLLNYALAILAVTLAAASLALLGTAGHTGPSEQVVALAQAAGFTPPAANAPPEATLPPWLLRTLLAFATAKLGLLFFISRNTRRANDEKWNDRAVDYRYLAERLRGMYYLARAGSHQPPAAAPPQFASRAVRQSAVDWLFDALVRAISPADLPHARTSEVPAHDGHGTVRVQKLLTVELASVVAQVRDRWIGEQTHYHDRNNATMHAISRWAEQTAVWLGRFVIVIVAFDFAIVGGELLHLLPRAWEPWARLATPWLVFISAVLPAVVAALNGIRFQSECQRLAERSAVMRVMLHGRRGAKAGDPQGRWQLADTLTLRVAKARAAPATDPGSWAHDAMRLTELAATDFVQEAAEWAVLYAKEVSDPG